MTHAKKGNKLDDRIKELEKEAARIKADIKHANRGRAAHHTASPDSPAIIPPVAPQPRPQEPHNHEATFNEQNRADRDLFDWQHEEPPPPQMKPQTKPQPKAPLAEPPRAPEPTSPRPTRLALDKKSLGYLTTGSFSPANLTPGDRRVQRSRVAFIVACVLIALFVVIQLIRRFFLY